jgi:mRNA interferase RelE/StbE
MEVKIERSFQKDLQKINQININIKVKLLIENCMEASDILEITGIKKLVGFKNQYRIRIGQYRIGLVFKDETLIFVRILHRKDIYSYFP